MNYEHLYNEIRFYLQSEKGDKERLQQESLRFISNENPLSEKLERGVLLGYLGDPRIVDPSSDAYWSRVEVSFLDLLDLKLCKCSLMQKKCLLKNVITI